MNLKSYENLPLELCIALENLVKRIENIPKLRDKIFAGKSLTFKEFREFYEFLSRVS
jgi:hypothetical protein